MKSLLEKEVIDQLKYQYLKKEIEDRRKEIKNGDILSHDEIWEQMNV